MKLTPSAMQQQRAETTSFISSPHSSVHYSMKEQRQPNLVNQELSKKIVYKAPAAHLERLGIFKRTENQTDLSRPLLK